RLPVDQIVGSRILRGRSPVPRRQVLEELDGRAGGSPQRRDAEPHAEDVVQTLLLRTVVLALAGHLEPERVPVAPETLRGVSDDNSRVVDAEEQAVARLAPLRVALARWEPENFKGVAVRVLEVERSDAARIRVPVGQALGRRRDLFDPVLPQPGVGA